MNRNGPVIIIEDDEDDQELLRIAFKQLEYVNELHFFSEGQKALDYLHTSGVIPFVILSDINLPKLDGFALRDKVKMDEKLQLRCIPYLFFSTSVGQEAVIQAYSLSIQGFFVKQDSIGELVKTIRVIVEYWRRCAAPNNFMPAP